MKKAKKHTPAPQMPKPGLNLPPFWHEVGQVLLLYALSAVMLCWIFPPHGVWPLAFVCLVPWAVATCRTQRAALVHWLSLLAGWGFFLVALRWLKPVTGLGYTALALYLAIYWTLAAWAIRTARRHGISPVWSLPITWVACEFLRATVMTGFPWLFISHSLYAQLPLIQIADLTGAYGVTFVALLINGLIVEALLQRRPAPGVRTRRWQLYAGAVTTAVVLIATLVYGFFRLGQVDFENDPARRGPRVAVIQEDFPLVSTPPYGKPPQVILAAYLSLAAQAAQEKPDLIAFPETAWSAYQNIDFIEQKPQVAEVRPRWWDWGFYCHQAVSAFARGDYSTVNLVFSRLETPELKQDLPRLPPDTGVPITTLVGAVALEQFPERTYPKTRLYNSALVYDRDGIQRRQRYNKRHLVPFGEFVPFRQSEFLGFDMHWLYRFLNSLSPFSNGGETEYSLTPGDEYTDFKLETANGERRFGVPICYEDATPNVIRDFVWDGAQRRVDFLVNISNDAWFLYSNELPQHLAICAFRAVENRIGIARAVNTGISGFIDPDGHIYARVTKDGRSHGKGIVGYAIEHVYLDDRTSIYGRFGDWFTWVCLLPAIALWLWAVFERWVLALRTRIILLLRKGVR